MILEFISDLSVIVTVMVSTLNTVTALRQKIADGVLLMERYEKITVTAAVTTAIVAIVLITISNLHPFAPQQMASLNQPSAQKAMNPAPKVTSTASQTSKEENYKVNIEAGSSDPKADKSYNPKELTVTAGTTVTWVNKDTTGHTVTSGNPGDNDAGSLFDSTKSGSFLIKSGDHWQNKFDKAGTFSYFCQVHPWMVGKVIVS